MERNKLTRYILASLLISMFLICSGCGEGYSYDFFHEEEKINKIEIVLVGDKNTDIITDYETICQIEDIDLFIENFKKIEFKRFLIGDPTYISSNEYAILIGYDDGTYEFVSHYAQQSIEDSMSYFGKFYCDKEEFISFINSYING